MSTTPYRILHLSDLHFTAGGIFEQIYGRGPSRQIEERVRDDLPHKFLDKLARYLADIEANESQDGWPRIVIVTGDLVHQGGGESAEDAEKAFELARKFLMEVAKQLRLSLDQVYIVPGNHDVDRTPNMQQAERFERFNKHFDGFTTATFKPRGPQAQFVQLGEVREGIEIELMLLVSPTFSGVPDTDREQVLKRLRRHLSNLPEVDPDQVIAEAREQSGPLDIAMIGRAQRQEITHQQLNEKAIRIAAMHHHLLPDPHIELSHFEPVIDCGRTLDVLLNAGFDLVLTGHKHNRRLVQYKNRTRENGSDQEIDVYSAPSLFSNTVEGIPPGPSVIETYGPDHPYYVCINHFSRDFELEYSRHLLRQGRVLPALVDVCAGFTIEDQSNRVRPLLESVSEGFDWAYHTDIEGLNNLFFTYWDGEVTEVFNRISKKQLIFRPPNIGAQWSELLSLAKDHPEGLRMVSDGDIDYWSQLDDRFSEACEYESAVRDYTGPKERLIVVNKQDFPDTEKRERWGKIVHAMAVDGLDVSLVDPEKLERRIRRDFAIIGSFAISEFLGTDKPGRRLREWFDDETIQKRERDWGLLYGHRYAHFVSDNTKQIDEELARLSSIS